MKGILLSLVTIAAVSGLVFGVSRAFFSDTEKSTGNTFTAGELNLLVDSQCQYGGQASDQCGTWQLKDLNPSADRFFNFTDIKPGDWGENTVSLHVVNNDYWACLDFNNFLANGNNSLALAHGLNFFFWNDINGNNIYEPRGGELPLLRNLIGNAGDILNNRTYILADKSTGTPWSGGPLSDSTKTKYLGLAWCAGTITVDNNTGAIACDGNSLGNDAQNGSLSVDIALRVVQSRNNPNFNCIEGDAYDQEALWLGSVHYVGSNNGYEFWFTPTQSLYIYTAGHSYHNTYRLDASDLPGYCGTTVVPDRSPYNLTGHTGETLYWKSHDETTNADVCL